MRIGRVRCKPRVPRRAHALRCPRRSLRRRDPARACRVAAGDFEGLSCRGDDVDFQRDRKTGNRSRNVPPAPSVGGFLSVGVARTLGSNSPSRRAGLACPATPSPGMQDMDSVTRNHLALTRPGAGAAPRSLSARTPKRHAAPESLLPSAGRALRHSRAKANGTPRPQRPRPFSRSSRDISRASAIASRMPRSVTPLPRPVARFAAKPSAAPLTLRTRPSALER